MQITIARPMRNTKYEFPENDGELREILFGTLKDSWESYISSWTVDDFDQIKRSTIDRELLELMMLDADVVSLLGPILKKKCAEASIKKEWLNGSINVFKAKMDELRDLVAHPMNEAVTLSVNVHGIEQLQIDVLVSYFKPLFPEFVTLEGEWETTKFPLYEVS